MSGRRRLSSNKQVIARVPDFAQETPAPPTTTTATSAGTTSNVDPDLRAALQQRMEAGGFAARFRTLLEEMMTGQQANGRPVGERKLSAAKRGRGRPPSGAKRAYSNGAAGGQTDSAKRRNKTGRKGRGNMYGSVPAPPDVTADNFVVGGEYDKPGTLLSQVRQMVAESDPSADANALVRLGTPQNLSYMHHDKDVASFMTSVWNDCPYCLGARESLRDLALAMNEHNKSIVDPSVQNRYALIIYDTKRHGNRGFASDKLGVTGVPSFHLVVPVGDNLSAEPWDSANVKTERRTADGRIVKTLPIDEILSDLSKFDKKGSGSSGSLSTKALQGRSRR